ncbi:MAG: YbjN domain-containing protein [Rhizobiales bacterium]|nr:YbjN domain-containing protein [Hyphomicrobiales bacterium]
MSFYESGADRAEHPVDVVERIASHHDWSFERDEDDEISISVAGGWTSYNVSFTWLPELEALHVACAFDLKVSEARRAETAGLISLVNEQMWVGHFDFWPSENVVMFRHALLLAGGVEPSAHQCEGMLAAAVEACERHYQAFQFVAWAGKSAREALDAAMFETVGEA